jgi:hypothetical protein
MNPGEFALAQTEVKLAKGQCWQLPGRVIVIKHVGVHLVEFGVKSDESLKGLRKRIGVATQMESIQKLVRYLAEHRAVLVK